MIQQGTIFFCYYISRGFPPCLWAQRTTIFRLQVLVQQRIWIVNNTSGIETIINQDEWMESGEEILIVGSAIIHLLFMWSEGIHTWLFIDPFEIIPRCISVATITVIYSILIRGMWPSGFCRLQLCSFQFAIKVTFSPLYPCKELDFVWCWIRAGKWEQISAKTDFIAFQNIYKSFADIQAYFLWPKTPSSEEKFWIFKKAKWSTGFRGERR